MKSGQDRSSVCTMKNGIYPFFMMVMVGLFVGTLALRTWADEDRTENVKDYLAEFSSPQFQSSYPQIYTALTNALQKLPEDVFQKITDRNHPVIFVLSITSGIGRYANSTEFMLRKDDLPAFKDGFYMIVLSDELNDASDPQAIEGILLHEMAHRYLDHLRQKEFSCDMEREANRLVKAWGFEKEFQKASDVFGSKKIGDSPCQDKEKDN